VASTLTSFDLLLAAAGLIAGTVPTNAVSKRARNGARTSVDAVLQAITTMSGENRAINRAIRSAIWAIRVFSSIAP